VSEGFSQPIDPSPPPAARVFVWHWPIRLTHWLLAAATLTAYFTANIFDTVHNIAGYTVLALIAVRVALGIAGPRHARFAHFPLQPRAVLRYLRDLTRGQARRYLGHNPAGAAMTVVLLIALAVSAGSGWMQITYRFFGVAWVQDLHTTTSNLVLALVIVHVLGVLLMCALLKDNLVRGMTTGWKKPPQPGDSACDGG
jgi:cytochrome b